MRQAERSLLRLELVVFMGPEELGVIAYSSLDLVVSVHVVSEQIIQLGLDGVLSFVDVCACHDLY